MLPDYVADCGGAWRSGIDGGELTLPVAAGLRRGVVTGRLTVTGEGEGSRVRFEVEREEYALNWGAVVILLIGALGALLLMLWPLYPALLSVAPVAALAAFSAWFLVNARLANRGPQEFLEALQLDLEARPDGVEAEE